MQLLVDILGIATPMKVYQTRLQAEKYVTVSTLDIVVDGGFYELTEASTNPVLCKEVRHLGPCHGSFLNFCHPFMGRTPRKGIRYHFLGPLS